MLNNIKIQKALPRERAYKLTDGAGLYLLVTPAGGKLWRFDYAFEKRRKTLSLGKYPEISLLEARQRHAEAKKLLAHGTDPAGERRKVNLQVSLEQAVWQWFDAKSPGWSETHADRLRHSIKKDLLPRVGSRNVADITAQEIDAVLQPVAQRSLETAYRLKIALRGIFDYAVVRGYCTLNPVTALRDVLPARRHKHFAALIQPRDVGDLLRRLDDPALPVSFVVRCALRLAPLVFVRPGELRQAQWREMDLENAVWNIPAEKMKMRQPHLVPLSRQAVAVLQDVQRLTGSGEYVFPGRSRRGDICLSDVTLSTVLRNLGYAGKMTVHGFRAMARTMLDEILHYPPDAIEAQLAHTVPDRLGRAYNRTQHLQTRKEMMQAWADYLDTLKAAAT